MQLSPVTRDKKWTRGGEKRGKFKEEMSPLTPRRVPSHTHDNERKEEKETSDSSKSETIHAFGETKF